MILEGKLTGLTRLILNGGIWENTPLHLREELIQTYNGEEGVGYVQQNPTKNDIIKMQIFFARSGLPIVKKINNWIEVPFSVSQSLTTEEELKLNGLGWIFSDLRRYRLGGRYWTVSHYRTMRFGIEMNVLKLRGKIFCDVNGLKRLMTFGTFCKWLKGITPAQRRNITESNASSSPQIYVHAYADYVWNNIPLHLRERLIDAYNSLLGETQTSRDIPLSIDAPTEARFEMTRRINAFPSLMEEPLRQAVIEINDWCTPAYSFELTEEQTKQMRQVGYYRVYHEEDEVVVGGRIFPAVSFKQNPSDGGDYVYILVLHGKFFLRHWNASRVAVYNSFDELVKGLANFEIKKFVSESKRTSKKRRKKFYIQGRSKCSVGYGGISCEKLGEEDNFKNSPFLSY